MPAKAKTEDRVKTVGVLTSGGDCPGLNAVIRGIVRTLAAEGVETLGFLEGFNGLIENRYMKLSADDCSGLLTQGGTILRTSRSKPHKMPAPDGGTRDMTSTVIDNYRRLRLDSLICLGGGGTQKSANRLAKDGGLNIVTVPKTIDNDVNGTDVCFGFDTGMMIAAEAIDRLHTTASSHHRVMLVDTMGHNAGWLALGAGIASGADVILMPEIPYSFDVVAESLLTRMHRGRRFSIVVIAEGAKPNPEPRKGSKTRDDALQGEESKAFNPLRSVPLADHIRDVTGLETRITSLGYLQRGGVPSPTDRLLSTAFGTMAAELALRREYGLMVAKRGDAFVPVPLKDVAGKRRTVPLDHPFIRTARAVGTCLGDRVTD